MSIEQFQATNDRERASRASTAEQELIADSHAETQSEETAKKLTRSIEHYQRVQKQIIELESNLKRSMDEAVAARQKKDLARAELLTTIGKAITADIANQQIDKEKFEKEIKDAGGDPAEFILQ